MKFGGLKLGEKPSEEVAADKAKPEEESTSFGEAGAGMAARAFVKAIGVDPDGVDMGKATKALKAMVTACMSSDEDY